MASKSDKKLYIHKQLSIQLAFYFLMGNLTSSCNRRRRKQSHSHPNYCIFCNIVKKHSGRIIYEDKDVLAFHDIHPKAPVHFLVIPKKHIDMVQNARTEDIELLGKLMFTAKSIASQMPELRNGFRLLMNNGINGRQEIYHIHLHVVGGTKLAYPKHMYRGNLKKYH